MLGTVEFLRITPVVSRYFWPCDVFNEHCSCVQPQKEVLGPAPEQRDHPWQTVLHFLGDDTHQHQRTVTCSRFYALKWHSMSVESSVDCRLSVRPSCSATNYSNQPRFKFLTVVIPCQANLPMPEIPPMLRLITMWFPSTKIFLLSLGSILFEAVAKVDLTPGSGRGALGRFVHVKFH